MTASAANPTCMTGGSVFYGYDKAICYFLAKKESADLAERDDRCAEFNGRLGSVLDEQTDVFIQSATLEYMTHDPGNLQ